MHAQRLAAGLTAALLLPLGACTGSEGKAEPPEQTSSTSPSPSPSESASDGPTLPPAAQGTDEAAAKAFVKFYFGLISEAMVTGNTEPLRAFSHPKCTSCINVAKKIDRAYENGATIKTKGWEPTKYIRGQQLPDGFEFYLRLTRHPRALFDADGLVDRDPRAVLSMRIIVLPTKQAWKTAWLDSLS